ncbi:MAG: glycosyltransferase family 39 protein [Hyphomicrobiaceae bacterium]|nr:glycosyltransferase family 39 protein [Hyphomicrobiaceae bacterium]
MNGSAAERVPTGLADGAMPTAGERHSGLLMVLAGVLAYVVLHVGFRLIASSTLGEDDTLEQILVQDLRAGYNPRQPPLYDWVLWLVQQATGPQLISFLAIKYAALTATAVFLYLAAFRIFRDRVWAVLTVESLALIYQISWRYHEGFTHEVLAMVAVVATLWAFLRLMDHGRFGDHVLFGVVSGLGLLTEPNYSVYQMCLWGAAMLQPAIRTQVVRPALLISAAIALIIASPFLVWLIGDARHWQAFFRSGPHSHLKDAMIGLKDAVRGPFMYLLPLVVIVPVIFPGFLATAWSDLRRLARLRTATETGTVGDEPDLEQFVLTTMVLAVALSVVGALMFGIGNYAMHVLMPLYVTSVVWLIGVARRSPAGPARRRRFATVALSIAVIALVARLANMFILDPVCGKCRWGIPYPALAAEMRASGFSDMGTIVAVSDELAGNLRQHFPDAKVMTRRDPDFTPSGASPRRGSVAFIWDAAVPDQRIAQWIGDLMAPGHVPAEARLVTIPWRHIWKPVGYRTSDWRLLVVER